MTLIAASVFLVGGGAFSLGVFLAPNASSVPLLRLMPGASIRQAEINALAVKLGELQARLLRLDGFARQVGSKAGIETASLPADQPVPRGGAAVPGRPLSAAELQQLIMEAESQLAASQDQLALANATLMLPSKNNLPIRRPVPLSLDPSSLFGARIDPLSGARSFHEGVDFPGNIGLPVHAAGNGKVTFAAYHAEYGNMVDLDHGNGLTSRYAHNSKLKVRVGDVVAAGQEIALLGNTGRSTGAHLHFEIRYKSVPQNPLRFLSSDIVASNTPAAKP